MHHCIDSMSLLCLIIKTYLFLSMYAQDGLISSHFISTQDRQEIGELGHTVCPAPAPPPPPSAHIAAVRPWASHLSLSCPCSSGAFYEDFVHQHYYRYSVNTQGNLNIVVTINTTAAIPYSMLPYKMVRASCHICSFAFLLRVLKQSPSRPHPQWSCFSPSHLCWFFSIFFFWLHVFD